MILTIADKYGTLNFDTESKTMRITFSSLFWDVTPSDIHHIYVEEPKLFKKGLIMFFATEDRELVGFDNNGNQYPLSIPVSYKYKDNFYMFYKTFADDCNIEIV